MPIYNFFSSNYLSNSQSLLFIFLVIIYVSTTGVSSFKQYAKAENYPVGYESNHQKQNNEGKRLK